MRPLVAISTLASLALALAVAIWARQAPLTAPAPDPVSRQPPMGAAARRAAQHAALSRIITTLHTLREYELGVDVNGALVVEIMMPPGYDYEGDGPTFEGRSYRSERFYLEGLDEDEDKAMSAIRAEMDWIDGYVGRVDHTSGPISHTPEDILAAGLSPRPFRFPSLSAAREWFPPTQESLQSSLHRQETAKAVDWRAHSRQFRAEYVEYKGNFESPGWRSIQRARVQALLDCLDGLHHFDMVYELVVIETGALNICPLYQWRFSQESNRLDSELRNWRYMAAGVCSKVAPHILTSFSSGCRTVPEGRVRHVKRGVGGRGPYDPDDVLAAGLAAEPRPPSGAEKLDELE